MKSNIILIVFFCLIGKTFSQTNNTVLKLELKPKIEYQTIHNFGASDAWSAQFVGNWPLQKKQAIADLLFSTENNTDGSLKGIGLSAWRFNIGAGSTEQNIKSGIKDEWRRAEGFLNDNESYNWNKQSGQQWFLKAARDRNVSCLIGFVNSPPVQFTKNNKAFSSDGLSSNLKEENYAKYASFLKNVVLNFKEKQQINFDYISPFNEPQWEWKNGGQEGSPWNNDELQKATKVIDSVFRKYNISSKIELTEAGAIDYLTSTKEKLANRSNQIESFFNPESEQYIGGLKTVASKVAGHSYFSTWNMQNLKNEREKIAQKLKGYPNLEYWMSEYCVLENNEEIKGGGKDLGINTALYVSRVIHSDLTIANASAWHWWLAMSPYNYKDGLIYHDKNKVDGTFETSKLLWALGNFSRFIRPEAKRVEVSYEDQNSTENLKNGVLVSAYKNKDNSIVVVVVNQKETKVEVNLNAIVKEVYTTNENFNLKSVKLQKNKKRITISPKSINTLLL